MLILSLILLSHEGGNTVFPGEDAKTTGLLRGYSSRAQEQVRPVHPMIAGSLAGIVIDSGGFPIPDARVERVGQTWERTIDERKTDADGRFSFAKTPKGNYFLKVSKSGFNTLLVKVITTNKSKARLKLSLLVSQ